MMSNLINSISDFGVLLDPGGGYITMDIFVSVAWFAMTYQVILPIDAVYHTISRIWQLPSIMNSPCVVAANTCGVQKYPKVHEWVYTYFVGS